MRNRGAALQEIAELAARHRLRTEEILEALDHPTSVDPVERSSGILARVLAYLGVIFVLAGVTMVIAMQWDELNSAVRVLITLGTGFALFLFALATTTDSRFVRVTTPMLLVAALLQPTGIVVMLQEYARGGDPEHGLLFMCTVMFLQQFLTFLARPHTILLFSALFFGAAGFGVLCGILDVDGEITALALGIALTCISYAVAKTEHAPIAPFWYLAGAVFFLAGAFELLQDSVLEIGFFGIAAGFMYLGTLMRSRTLLFASVIALTSFTGYYFRDSLANAFGLIVLGVVLIGFSAFAMSLNRKFIRGRT